MKVFVTGASGFIGSRVVPELIRAGHQVIGLARSDESAKKLEQAGATVQRGSLDDIESLKAGAAASDGVIHLAFIHDFIHDFSKYATAMAADQKAIEAIGQVLAGTNKPFVGTSGTISLKPGQLLTEDVAWTEGRGVSEVLLLGFASKGVRSSVIRLSPTVHGDHDQGFVPALINVAKGKKQAGYIGDGSSRWSAIHVLDAAVLYRLAVEKAPAGTILHGVGEEGVATKEIATVFGRKLNVPVVSLTPEEAMKDMGFLGHFFGMDSPVSNKKTQEILGWKPTHKGLLEDLETGTYF
ncbi:hypothetical protein SmJEL517_g01947 [Synchytrium microbalum]|uniref:NAD-dependent epimerase/dehydratase domain-containing protein n=1 Tax=Synchytrium microbalum TaxID=1806994 RepID=A0A507C7T1_9FUNG|nr:uncharacterized protein SmJEL517_g01947 [Synchytrium microbalum]TPX35662.1 hypothetical protein SmJEL517_g01947 [Synchytrium microbalum]